MFLWKTDKKQKFLQHGVDITLSHWYCLGLNIKQEGEEGWNQYTVYPSKKNLCGGML